MYQQLIWKEIHHSDISPGYVISQYGDIKQSSLTDDKSYKASYHSSNGYDYAIFMNEDMKPQLFPIDDIIATVFVPIPDELINKPVKIRHINGDNRDNNLDNLEWVEDLEEWRKIDLPEILSKGYSISNWGRIKNPKGEVLNLTNRNGYNAITLRTIGWKRKLFFVHRIEMVVFNQIQFINDANDINHIDGDKRHNHIKNLEIVSRRGNNDHAIMIGLRNIKLTNDVKSIISHTLMENCGSIAKTINDIRVLHGINVTEEMVHRCKRILKSEGVVFNINYKRKISDDMLSFIKDLIITYNGDCNLVLCEIKNKYPDINIHNIKSVKRKMVNEGFTFKDMRLNRKISETERHELINVIKTNKYCSMSDLINFIHMDERYANVSIYDLKYLKRRYVK